MATKFEIKNWEFAAEAVKEISGVEITIVTPTYKEYYEKYCKEVQKYFDAIDTIKIIEWLRPHLQKEIDWRFHQRWNWSNNWDTINLLFTAEQIGLPVENLWSTLEMKHRCWWDKNIEEKNVVWF